MPVSATEFRAMRCEVLLLSKAKPGEGVVVPTLSESDPVIARSAFAGPLSAAVAERGATVVRLDIAMRNCPFIVDGCAMSEGGAAVPRDRTNALELAL